MKRERRRREGSLSSFSLAAQLDEEEEKRKEVHLGASTSLTYMGKALQY